MKSFFMLLTAVLLAAAATRSQAQTLNWGNEVDDVITDSDGNLLDGNFVFELGAFLEDFEPLESNKDEWFANWRVFDTAEFNPLLGYFTSATYIPVDVTSPEPGAATGSFAGAIAYLWIRDNNAPVEGAEWLVVRAAGWTFPESGQGCCSGLPIEWAVSDLTPTDVPKWGGQNAINGPGEFTVDGTTGLQTHTFVPEPSAALLAAVASLGMVLRRRRNA